MVIHIIESSLFGFFNSAFLFGISCFTISSSYPISYPFPIFNWSRPVWVSCLLFSGFFSATAFWIFPCAMSIKQLAAAILDLHSAISFSNLIKPLLFITLSLLLFYSCSLFSYNYNYLYNIYAWTYKLFFINTLYTQWLIKITVQIS